MKTYTFVLLTASALAATAMECNEDGGTIWTPVALSAPPAADTDAAACKTACTTDVEADADKADKDFCCESAVTAAVEAVEADTENNVEAVEAVNATHTCALYSAATGADSISTDKADANGVTYAAWDYTAGAVAEPEKSSEGSGASASETPDDADAESTDADADADSASKMVASVLASAAFVAAMY